MQIEYSSDFLKALISIANAPREGSPVMQNLHLGLHPPPVILAQIDRPMNALLLCPDSFHAK